MRQTLKERVGVSEADPFPAYAWPGGYPIMYYDSDNALLCPDCANKPDMSTSVVEYDIHWEGEDEICEDCGKPIPSAYGEPNDD